MAPDAARRRLTLRSSDSPKFPEVFARADFFADDRDSPDASSGAPTLRDKLPADLRTAPSGPDFAALPFTSLYLLDDEWAAEIANRTMRA
jgi:hypothetical protein